MTNFEKIKGVTPEELTQLFCKLSTCSLYVASGFCHNQHTGYIDWLEKEEEGREK